MGTQIINNWFYGEIGERLIGNRTSEIYTSSAKEIRNMIVSDLGTLKIAKQFISKELTINGDVRKVIDIKEDRYIILTTTHVYQLRKLDDSIIHTLEHNIGVDVDLSLIGKDFITLFNKSTKTNFKLLNINDLSIKSDYRFRNPVKDKKTIELDLWRVSKDPINDNKFRIVKMASSQNPLIKIKNNNIYLHNSDIQIKRVYVNYNSVVDVDYFNSVADGDIYGILRVYYEESGDDKYIIDNTIVSIGGLTDDSKYKGKYFTQINGGDCEGELTFGKFIDLSKPTYISFFQDRTIFYLDGYMYFSKIRDYFNFRNSIESDASFYVQLNPINNSTGTLLGMVSANGLYVLTTAGIYLIGYNNYSLTPSSVGAGILTISDMGVKDVYDVLDNTIYFMNSNNILKAIMLDNQSLQLSFNAHTVDKYSVKNLFKDITKVSIEDKDYIMARGLDSKVMYLIEPVSNGIFRKVSLDFEFGGQAFGINDRFIIGNKVYSLGGNNYTQARLFLNPPPFPNNNILMDNSSSINSVAIKLLNEDREAIKGVKINNKNIQNLGSNVNDIYSIWKIKTKFTVGNGFGIDIFTNENNKVCELQAIQLDITAIEDR